MRVVYLYMRNSVSQWLFCQQAIWRCVYVWVVISLVYDVHIQTYRKTRTHTFKCPSSFVTQKHKLQLIFVIFINMILESNWQLVPAKVRTGIKYYVCHVLHTARLNMLYS